MIDLGFDPCGLQPRPKARRLGLIDPISAVTAADGVATLFNSIFGKKDTSAEDVAETQKEMLQIQARNQRALTKTQVQTTQRAQTYTALLAIGVGAALLAGVLIYGAVRGKAKK
jgi:hypothetical protein